MTHKIPTDLADLARHLYTTASSKGWHEKDRPVPEIVALLHSEASELFEEHRAGREPTEVYFNHPDRPGSSAFPDDPEEAVALAASGVKPEGPPVELADLVIRCLDAAEEWGIDIAHIIRLKDAYNCTRPYKHGNKRA